jgi:hypothetical protein
MYRRSVVVILVIAALSRAHAQGEKQIIPAVHADTPPKIDGVLSDECWQKAPSVDEFHFLPDGTKGLEPTTAWICYDEGNIYVAYHCKDSQPDKIVTQQKKRGGSLKSDDWVGIDIACYQDRHPVVWFDVSAGGVQVESLQSGDASKIEWKGDWTAVAKRTADGYIVEMAIPFSILQYDPNAKSMSIAFLRQHARTTHTWWSPDMGPTGNGEPKNFHTWQGLDLPRPKIRPLVMAYLLGGTGDGASSQQAGIDIKHALTPTLTAALTANPDFRNVEQSVSSVDFTYSEQYLPDSRPFFQEGGGYFPGSDIFSTGGIEAVDLGGKVYGKYGNYNLGVLNTQQFGTANYSAMSVGREWPDKAGVYLQGVQSSKTSVDNTVGKMSGNYYIYNRNDHKINLDGAMTLSSLTGAGQSKSYSFGLDSWGGPRVLGWYVGHDHIDPDFAPVLGYVPDTDIQAWHISTSLRNDFSSGKLNHWTTDLSADLADHTDGSLYYNTIQWNGHMHYQGGKATYLTLVSSDRRQPDENNPDVIYSFHDEYARFRYRLASTDLYRSTTAEIACGRRAGGPYMYYGLETGWLLTDKLSVRTSYSYGSVKAPSPLAYSSNQFITTLAYDLDKERTVAGRFRAGSGASNLYLSYKQRVRSGMDIYLIYGDPNTETTRNCLLLKLIRPL